MSSGVTEGGGLCSDTGAVVSNEHHQHVIYGVLKHEMVDLVEKEGWDWVHAKFKGLGFSIIWNMPAIPLTQDFWLRHYARTIERKERTNPGAGKRYREKITRTLAGRLGMPCLFAAKLGGTERHDLIAPDLLRNCKRKIREAVEKILHERQACIHGGPGGPLNHQHGGGGSTHSHNHNHNNGGGGGGGGGGTGGNNNNNNNNVDDDERDLDVHGASVLGGVSPPLLHAMGQVDAVIPRDRRRSSALSSDGGVSDDGNADDSRDGSVSGAGTQSVAGAATRATNSLEGRHQILHMSDDACAAREELLVLLEYLRSESLFAGLEPQAADKLRRSLERTRVIPKLEACKAFLEADQGHSCRGLRNLLATDEGSPLNPVCEEPGDAGGGVANENDEEEITRAGD